jgi:diguanylate cyclase (GGDEF)-like protein
MASLRQQFGYIFPSALPLPMQQKRIAVIQARIRLVVAVMAIGIPAWSALEFLVFPYPLWASLLKARLLAGAALGIFFFFSNRIHKKSAGRLWRIYIPLSVLFVIPTLLYVFCIRLPEPVIDPSLFASAVLNSYSLLPLVILSCIGFFPLTVIESACIIAPFLTAYYLTTPQTDAILWSLDLGMMWVMALIAVISIVICYSQLQMLVQLVSYSSYDLLTNCLGRRSGEEVVKTLWHYSIRKKSNFAVAFVDLDHFKQVNDHFGHQAGDVVLANTAAAIKKALRESDFIIRWGGEEFLVVLPDATLENASKAMQRVANIGFGLRPDGSAQTASIGISERLSETAIDETSLIQLADERLYKAKSAGRSRILGSEMVIIEKGEAA